MVPILTWNTNQVIMGKTITPVKGVIVFMAFFCDDLCRIRHLTLGWPGSIHDNRVWTTCEVHQNSHLFFNRDQYLLGDSAFQPSEHMVPAFKKPYGAPLGIHEQLFNTHLSKMRIRVEHSIGRLKGRFQILRGYGL